MRLDDLTRGIDDIGDSESSPSVPPEWLDKNKFHRGQLFFQRHILGMINILYQHLIIGFNLQNLLEPLIYTHQSNTPAKALKRYLQTLHHLLLWHTGDVWKPGTLASQSIHNVRNMHNKVANEMNSKEKSHERTRGTGIAGENIYFSQYDMAIVQSAFMSGVVTYPKQFGINCSTADLEDYIHFWRGIGYLLGIQDKFNMCSGDYAQTYEICAEIKDRLVIPTMKSQTDQTMTMASAFCNGLNRFFRIPLCSVPSVHAYWFYYIDSNVPRPSLGLADLLRLLWLRLIVLIIWWFPSIDNILSQQILKTFNSTCKQNE